MGLYLDRLLETAALREPAILSAITALGLPRGSCGLDAGCGAGLHCSLLADAVGPGGRVVGLDISEELLAYGRAALRDSGLKERISFKQGRIEAIPFGDDTFDWVWSVDCVGYGPWEPLPLLREMKRVTKPGGKLAIMAWSSECILPGHPLLEARLRATTPGLAPASAGMAPSRHFLRALGWLRELGLGDPEAHVFSMSVHAPLSDEQLKALESLFDMRWPGAEAELEGSDRAEFNRLCRPDSPDFLLKHEDYYAFFTYSMFNGVVR